MFPQEEMLMNLTPPTPPVVKRSRAKTTTAAAESKKPTLTTKTTRTRKRPVAEPEAPAAIVESTMSYTSDQLRSMIATAAYYRAVARNFAPGNDVEDWLVAEQQVMASLS
jgi:hypothetical protein